MSELNKGRIMYGISIVIILWCFNTLIGYFNSLTLWFNIIAYSILSYTLYNLVCRVYENEIIWREK